MNELSEVEFLSQVGDYGYREVARLAEWLLATEDPGEGPDELELKCRYAVSMVTKGEAEIFGLSDPRFAIRLYLEHQQGTSVLNLRRIDRMRAANPRWGRRLRWLKTYSREPLKALPTPKDRPREFLRQASRIGDCLLQAPARLQAKGEDWIILKADLGREYGETTEAGELTGTPYLRHIPLAGGGLCAQAVCFMATSLLHEYASGIHGLLEVTALAQKDELQKAEREGFNVYEMQISGLNYGGLTRYFSEIQLRAIKQVPKTMGYAKPSADWTSRSDAFSAAARAYLRSGMPIILTVDGGRLAAPSDHIEQLNAGMEKPVEKPIYAANGWAHPGFENPKKGHFRQRRDHAVLLVGCKEESGSEVFLVNDPASLPFLKATTGQLADAGYYASRWSEKDKRHHTEYDSLRSLHCLPITPGAVKLPLLWWLPDSQVDEEDSEGVTVEHWRDGLFGIVPVLFSGAIHLGRVRLPYIAPQQRYRGFRLLRMEELVRHCAEFLQGETVLPDIAALREQLIERFEWKRNHWAWVQFVQDPLSIWVYDAEASLPINEGSRSADAGRGFLRVGVWRQDEGWKQVVAPRGKRTLPQTALDDGDGFPRARRPASDPRFTVSSAASARGFQDHLKKVGKLTPSVELYAFMRGDVSALTGRKNSQSAISWMAGHNHPRHIEAAVDQLREWAKEAGVSIAEITSYLPEIAEFQARDARTALDALRFLVRLSDALEARREFDEPPATQTITLAAGNRIQGIWPGRLAKEETGMVYIANVVSRETLGRIVLNRLREFVHEMDAASHVRFALDLEPGELHLLNDWDALAWFTLELDSARWADDLGDCVGFTLNVPRWGFLAGIDPDRLATETGIGASIRRRIFHAQIADVGKGQFGGQIPGVMHEREDFLPWLRLIRELAEEERKKGMHFSGNLALALEACADASNLQRAFDQLQKWSQEADLGPAEALPVASP